MLEKVGRRTTFETDFQPLLQRNRRNGWLEFLSVELNFGVGIGVISEIRTDVV